MVRKKLQKKQVTDDETNVGKAYTFLRYSVIIFRSKIALLKKNET